MDLELATAPLTRFQVRTERAQGGITVQSRRGRRRLGRDPLLRLPRRRHRRRHPAQDRAPALPRRLPPRRSRATSARSSSRRARWSSTRPRSRGSVDIEAIANRRFKVVLDYSFGAAASVMPNVLAKIGAEVLSVNPYASTAYATEAAEDHGPRVERLGNLVRSSGSDLGVVFDADGETATFIDDRGEPLVRRAGSARAREPRVPGAARRAARAAGLGEPGGRAHRRAARRDDHLDEALGRAPHGDRGRGRHRLRGVAGRRVHLARRAPRVRRGRDAAAPARPARRRPTRSCRR